MLTLEEKRHQNVLWQMAYHKRHPMARKVYSHSFHGYFFKCIKGLRSDVQRHMEAKHFIEDFRI